jgi:hypothetical protein
MTKHLILSGGHWEWADFVGEQLPAYLAPVDTAVNINAGPSATTPGLLFLVGGENTGGGAAGSATVSGGASSAGGAASLTLGGAGSAAASLYGGTGGAGLGGGGLVLNGGDGDTGNVLAAQLGLQAGDGSATPGGASLRTNGSNGPGVLVSVSSVLTYIQAADPGDIANPATATAEDVANKLNALMAAMRTAGFLA